MEQFEGLSHEEIFSKVDAMRPGLMHDIAEVYDSIANSLGGALFGAHLAVQRELSDGLDGQFADAANQATRTFYDQSTDVLEVIRAVGLRIDAAAYAAGVVKKSVPAPPVQSPTSTAISTTVIDPAKVAETVVGATDPAAAAAFDRMKEDQRSAAVEVMNMAYKPTYQPAGDGVPTFVPVQAPGDPSTSPVPGGTSTSNPGGSTTASAPGSETPGGETPGENEVQGESAETSGAADDSQDTTAAGANENPTTQQPSGTTTGTPTGDPQRTTPSTTTTGSPSVPSGTPSGSPSGTPQNQTPGKTVTGTPGSPNASTGSPAAASTAAGTNRGMSGMPGMMSPGGGKRGEGDDEHKTPDYLIRDREEELFGAPVDALGGVLGADAPAAQPADDRGDRR
ncbi:hypothetical protein [Nocardia sp. NBC_00416]|uniref:hypothetical protein n=1 Tax=Nocardia sp. NBC_00416 TaxID=2975991 RepID=UPI002E1DCED0